MSLDVETILQQAREHHAAGDLAAAEKTLNDAHRTWPEAVEFVAFLGDVRMAQGRAKKAAETYRIALKLAPQAAILHASLAMALEASGDNPGAVDALTLAVSIDPENPALFNNLGLLKRRIGQKNDAVTALQKAVELAPKRAAYHANLARVLQDIGELSTARKAVEKSLNLNPDSADALVNFGCILRDLGQANEAIPVFLKAGNINPSLQEVWLNLALAYRDEGSPQKGIEAVRKLLSVNPTSAEAYANLGRFHQEIFEYPAAEAAYQQALQLSPENSQTLANFASLMTDMDQLDEAEALCERALEINPGHVQALSNLALAVMQRGDQTRAIDLMQTALVLEPDNVQIQRNLADPLFLIGRIKDGWAAYERRWEKPDRPRRPHLQPEWQGEDLKGKTLLVWAEQGIGDTLLFSTCLPDVLATAQKTVFEVDPRFVSLYERTFPDLIVVPRQDDPHPLTRTEDIDFQCPAGGLARWTRPDLASFPRQPKFLEAAPDRVNWWRQKLTGMGHSKIKVGFFWRSGGDDRTFNSAYPGLDEWAPILRRRDVDFVSLQYGQNGEILARQARDLNLNIHFPDDIDLFDDIDDIAALSTALDAMAGPLTTNCWLTAAMGTPTLVAGLPADWMLMGTDDFLWLPLVRYIQREPRGGWQSVLTELDLQLTEIVKSRGHHDD